VQSFILAQKVNGWKSAIRRDLALPGFRVWQRRPTHAKAALARTRSKTCRHIGRFA